MLNNIIRFFLENKLVTVILLTVIIAWGVVTAPFNWNIDFLPRDPVPTDAIPDIGENQQIVFVDWPGKSPQDVEDQITYPLTTSLLGIPGIRTIRSISMFGFSSIFLIFEEDVEFYWSRSRILEQLNSLPAGTLPQEVQPALGPDATALGQVFWYTLEGRDPSGNPTGGWDLHELRSIQDFYVGYALASARGVSEVAPVGGFVKEYQVDVDPNALKAHNVTLLQVMQAVQNSNLDVGAQTIEINKAEYLVRGLGYVKDLSDIEKAVVTVTNNIPIRIKDIGRVSIGPAERRGILDKSGAEVVGGVVVARYGANPFEVINNVKQTISQIEAGLPSKVLPDGTKSQVKIIPFYDRTQLIQETIGTLEDALTLQALITIVVIIVLIVNLRASILISSMLPLAVLLTFIGMKYLGVDANIVALSGIAISIGTVVDVGIILSENMLRHLKIAKLSEPRLEVIFRAASEVSTAIVTAISTTIVSFIPVFMMEAAEGKLFSPLAWTKTLVLLGSVVIGLLIIPAFAHIFFTAKINSAKAKRYLNLVLVFSGLVIALFFLPWAGIVLMAFGFSNLISARIPKKKQKLVEWANSAIAVLAVTFLLTTEWLPLGPGRSLFLNALFVAFIIIFLLGFSILIIKYYTRILAWCMDNRWKFLSIPAFLILFGLTVWIGFDRFLSIVPSLLDEVGINIRTTGPWRGLTQSFPGVGKEFMPSLDEGSFLLMPTSMPHAGIEQNKDVLQKLDMAVTAIPEVEIVVGKLGRAESALDPAPISMFENVINYKSEYITDADGNRIRFAVDREGEFLRDSLGNLVPDRRGEYFRQWRDHIRSPEDIWNEIVQATNNFPGVTSAPKLQPIETRLIMMQTGMRAPMGIKVKGPDLETIESFGFSLENILMEVPSVKAEAVFADRVVGKPYLNIDIDRDAISRYGLNVIDVQRHIEVALGGMNLTTSVEGRERYGIRVRYPRELRNRPETIESILVATTDGTQVPLGQLSKIEYVRGPQMIKSEDTFLTSYVLFDKKPGYAEVNVVEEAQRFIQARIDDGSLEIPAGVTYEFTGSYENQVRAEKRLSIIVPLVLMIIFLILYFQFKSILTAVFIFLGIAVAFSGGFMMIWLFGQEWFLNFAVFDLNIRDLFQMRDINLSVAVWVGFIALFGVATDDGVLMGTYLGQVFEKDKPTTKKMVRHAVLKAGSRRVRPAMTTTITTVLALLPVLTSTGRGSDIMIPMAIPLFGGMIIASITMFVVPVLYHIWQEKRLLNNNIQNDVKQA